MYLNLLAEMTRKGLSRKDLASKLNMPYSTLLDKLAKRTAFTLDECLKIKNLLCCDVPLEVLFKK